MKPDYDSMSRKELRAYVLSHKDDMEAMRKFFEIKDGVTVKRYPPVCTEDGTPIEENIRIMEEAIRERIEQEKRNSN